MSYLVLARKWRPKIFSEVVGQEHVVRTLRHALENDRLHHAYLFSGTRGVGKTTLARILAKALNCEQGVSSEPCNECNACTQIDEGRFIDLIEVDAASRTKVEDTRSLLENVPYKATIGRYKVYLIDEIHMLTGHSFNALLKTLEEPPSHVKFLMATTDPQKLPVTVLSRCIQFNLRAMEEREISEQLERILIAEKIDFQTKALTGIARQSHGSMRDGLSLLDQAISYTNGNVRVGLVRDMLGMVSDDYIYALLEAIATKNASEALRTVKRMCERSINFEATLDDILLKLHSLSLLKIAPSALEARSENLEELKRIEKLMSKEDIQLYYQIGLIGKRDLALAPEAQQGFEMVLMRMLAFHPSLQQAQHSSQTQDNSGGLRSTPPPSRKNIDTKQPRTLRPAASTRKNATPRRTAQHSSPTSAQKALILNNSEDWIRFVNHSNHLDGFTKLFASNIAFQKRSGNTLFFHPPNVRSPSMEREENKTNLLNVLRKVLGNNIKINFTPRVQGARTPEKRMARERQEKLARVRQQIEREDVPKRLEEEFGAKIDISSIRYPKPRKRREGQ